MGLRLLCVVAHPDDECFAFGGALALAAEQGVEVYVVCFTDGQAASHRGTAASQEELGQMRRVEFAASCKVLGVTRCEVMDYADGKLEFADFSKAAGLLVEKMRAFQPHVVLTFGSDGAVNTHPDHTMVSALTSAAYHWAASAKRYPDLGAIHHADRLYLLTTTYFMDGRPAPMPAPWTAELDIRHLMRRKQEAFEQHVSQAPLVERSREMFAKYGQAENYLLAAVREPQPQQKQTGFFDGLDG